MGPKIVFHGVTLPGRRSTYSLWFSDDPCLPAGSLAYLIDGERIDRAGRSYPLTRSEKLAAMSGPWTARHQATFNN